MSSPSLSTHPATATRFQQLVNSSIIVVLLGLAVRLVFSWTTYKFFIDDAYILLRYARNFADGNGLVYNVGEKVLGFSSPLFEALTAVVAYLFRPVSDFILLNVIDYTFFAVVLWLAMRLFARRPLLCAIPVLLVLYFPYIDASLSGMETMLMLSAMLGALACLATARLEAALVLATVSCLIRPEGFLYLAVVGLYVLRQGRWWYGRAYLISGALLLTWMAVTSAYYGTFIPQSMLAKSGHVIHSTWGGFRTGPLDKNVILAFGFSDIAYLGWPGVLKLALISMSLGGIALLLYGAWHNFREKSFLLVPTGFYLAAWAFYVVGQPVRIFSWYAIPTSLCFFIGCLDALTRLLGPVKLPRWIPLGAATLACFASIVVALPKRTEYLKTNLPEMQRFSNQVKAIPGAQSVMVADIGLIGYTTQLRIVDLGCLISPAALKLAPRGEIPYFSDLVVREKPTVICLGVDPTTVETINESEHLYHTFRSDGEAQWFRENYRILPIPAGRYKFVYVARSLAEAKVE